MGNAIAQKLWNDEESDDSLEKFDEDEESPISKPIEKKIIPVVDKNEVPFG